MKRDDELLTRHRNSKWLQISTVSQQIETAKRKTII